MSTPANAQRKRIEKVSIVIPVYNEERTIERVIAAVTAVDLSPLGLEREIVVVDDGSRDTTLARLNGIGNSLVKVIQHQRNQGKGAAIRTGLKHVTGDVVLIQDADMEYDPQDYPTLLRPIVEGRAQVVYGSRFLKARRPANMSIPHLWGNRFLTWLVNLLYGAGLTDLETCYKVFRTEVIQSVNLRCQQFEFCPEVTAKLCKKGLRITEVPISYLGRTVEEGKKIAWKDGRQAVTALLRYRFFD